MTRARLFGVFPVLFFLATVAAGEDSPKTELEGMWTGISLETNDGKKDDDYAKTVHWTIVGDKIAHKEKLISCKGIIRVGAKNSPKTFDAIGKEGIVDFNWVGIYELLGDTLKLCYSTAKDGVRPKEFKSNPATILIMKRGKLE